MRNILFLFICLFMAACSSGNTERVTKEKKFDYSNINAVDSLIKTYPESTDTIFLGFIMNMSNSEYKKHIQKLKNDGFDISYKKNNALSGFNERRIDLGEGHVLNLIIADNSDGKNETGKGHYILIPVFENDKLSLLQVVALENWEGSSINDTKWIRKKVRESTIEMIDDNFKQAMINNGIIKSFYKVRVKNDVIVYEGEVSSINYASVKYILKQIHLNLLKNNLIEEVNKEIKF